MTRETQVREFSKEDLSPLRRLITRTIDASYGGVYPTEAIEFFKDYHSEQQILGDATAGYTVVAEHGTVIVGTGTLSGTNIRRVFVDPRHQHRGAGKLIVRELAERASIENSPALDLEASLPSVRFWESLGFVVVRDDHIAVKNGQKLRYFKMVKTLDDTR